jgi:hypothetical protein
MSDVLVHGLMYRRSDVLVHGPMYRDTWAIMSIEKYHRRKHFKIQCINIFEFWTLYDLYIQYTNIRCAIIHMIRMYVDH